MCLLDQHVLAVADTPALCHGVAGPHLDHAVQLLAAPLPQRWLLKQVVFAAMEAPVLYQSAAASRKDHAAQLLAKSRSKTWLLCQ